MTLRGKVFALGFLFVIGADVTHATPMVKINRKESKKVNPDGTMTHTVVLENTGDMDAINYKVTSQPYTNGGKTTKQEKPGLTIPKATINPDGTSKPGTLTVTFNFPKDFPRKYTDLYDENGKFKDGTVGPFAAQQVSPQGPQTGMIDFGFPYPDPVNIETEGMAATFFIEITNIVLPIGWSISDFSPSPDDPFTLELGDFQPISIDITTSPTISPGDFGFIDFDFVQPDLNFRFHSSAGVEVVPEPSTIILFAVGILGIIGMGYRRRKKAECAR